MAETADTLINDDIRSIEFCKDLSDQDEYIRQLELSLTRGASIDFMFRNRDMYGSVLIHAIIWGFDRIVRYTLDRGASLTTKSEIYNGFSTFQNALEVSAFFLASVSPKKELIFHILKEKCLELFSPYGLTSFHIDCAEKMVDRSRRLKGNLKTFNVNAAVAADSPFWPGMTPLLVAAKSTNYKLVEQLLNAGALPTARDAENNTPLHYLASTLPNTYLHCENYHDFFKRLFIFDGSDTFSTLNGESHFHIACRMYPEMLDVVKMYLDQGVSPDLQTKNSKYTEYEVVQAFSFRCLDLITGMYGLHFISLYKKYSRKNSSVVRPEFIQLLLEYGADVNLKDFDGDGPLDCLIEELDTSSISPVEIDCICLLLEAGASLKTEKLDVFLKKLGKIRGSGFWDILHDIFCCVQRPYLIHKNGASEGIKKIYEFFLIHPHAYDSQKKDYEKLCLEELKVLSERGLRQILDSTIINRDFKAKFESLIDSPDLQPQLYPIYGNMLKTQVKRKFSLYEDKRKKINKAVPHLQLIFQNHCIIPDVVAQNILWNLEAKDIDRLLL